MWRKLIGHDSHTKRRLIILVAQGFLTWLTKEPRDFLNGRYLSVNWDVNELVAKKDEIVEKDLLKFRMTV